MLGCCYGWLCVGSRIANAYLLVDEALPLAGVLVGQVERVAGELDTTTILALGEVRVVAACGCKRTNQLMCPSILQCAYAPAMALRPRAVSLFLAQCSITFPLHHHSVS